MYIFNGLWEPLNSAFVPTPEWLLRARESSTMCKPRASTKERPSQARSLLRKCAIHAPAAVDGLVHRVETQNKPGVVVTHSLDQYPQCRLQARSITAVNASRAWWQASKQPSMTPTRGHGGASTGSHTGCQSTANEPSNAIRSPWRELEPRGTVASPRSGLTGIPPSSARTKHAKRCSAVGTSRCLSCIRRASPRVYCSRYDALEPSPADEESHEIRACAPGVIAASDSRIRLVQCRLRLHLGSPVRSRFKAG